MSISASPSSSAAFDEAKALIDTVQVVSFDLFDTLITRMVEKPWHAFFIVEKVIAERRGWNRSFVPQRRQAEAIARQRVWKERAALEVTLDEIYDTLADFGFTQSERQMYKEEELTVEKAICYADPTNKKLYDYAMAKGKTVILVSDIYLSESTIEDLAKGCGYSANHRLFISSTHRESKGSEGLFSLVLGALRKDGIIRQPSDVLHIGDNHHSDIHVAAKWGIKTLHRPDPVARFRRDGLGAWSLLEGLSVEDPLARSLMIGLFTRYWLENGARSFNQLTARDLGFYVVGPLLSGFALWLHHRCLADKVETLFFLARDGWIFKQAFDKIRSSFGTAVETIYVYASRRAVYFPSIVNVDAAANKFFLAAYTAPPKVREYFERVDVPIEPFAEELAQIFGSLDAPVAAFDFRLGHFFRQRVLPNLREQIERERELATAYMAQMGMLGGKVALCDIGYFGSMQDGFARIAHLAGQPTRFKGYYFATHDKHAYGYHDMTGWLFDAGKPREDKDCFQQSTAVMELFFTGLHGTVLGYKRENDQIVPILRPVSDDEQKRFALVTEIQAGALHGVDMFLSYASAYMTKLSPQFCLSPWRSFVTDPPWAIAQLFTGAKHNDGVGISSYSDIIESPPPWSEIIRRPSCLVQSYWRSSWRAGYRKWNLTPVQRKVLDCMLKYPGLTHKIEVAINKIRNLL